MCLSVVTDNPGARTVGL